MIFAAAALVGVRLCTGLRSFKTTIGTPKPPGRNFVLALALVSALVPRGAHAQTQVITLNGNGTGRTFDGVGAVSAGASSRLLIDYPEPYRSQILDFLFKPHFGASLQSLKVEIGGDVDSSGGAEPSHMRSRSDANFTRGYEGWLMNEAKRRNPNIQLGALAWGAPGWLGGGQFYSQDTIDYIVAFLSGIKATYGFDINYVGIWNETPYNTAWIKGLKDAILAAGLPTRIVAADQNVGQWGIVDDMLADPALMAAVDIVGEHYVQSFSTDAAQSLGKPLWDSEDGPWRGDWTGAAAIAQLLNRNYISGKLTKTEIWSPVTSYYDIMTLSGSGLMRANTPWSGNYEVQPAIWAMAHTAQFADPGWQYIDQSSGLFNGSSYVTLRNGSNYSVIVETLGETANRQVRFQLTGGLSQGTVRVWRSNATSQFVRLADITPSGGRFTVTLAPRAIYSFTTTNVQTKGNATPPAPSSFPIPYQDDFESYPFEKSPKYLSDINGAFETTACGGGRPGRCLQQLITTPPIPWPYAGPSEPASVLGDTSLSDYAVSADVMFEQAGYVKLVGRLLSKEQVSGTMNAYQFSLRNSGEWSLRITDSIAIASGSIGAIPLNTWHAVRLVLNGSQIEAFVDGIPIVSVMDQTYSIGLAGIGVRGFTRAQFDNFSIDLVEPVPEPSTVTIPQTQMIASAASQAVSYEASRALDGNLSTFWTTNFSCTPNCQPVNPLPQSIVLNLGGTYNVTRVRYLPRQDGNPNGQITSYRIDTSMNGTSWTQVAQGTWAANATEKSATFVPTMAGYVRLEALQGVNGYAGAAEINVEYALGGPSNPVPTLSSLNPASVQAGSPGVALSISGSDFVSGAVVRVDGADRPSTVGNSTTVTASLTSADLAIAGSRTITVFNPAPGGGVSNSLTLTVTSAGGSVTLPQAQMTATAASQAVTYEASRALDGNLSTFWTTNFSCTPNCQPVNPLPQSIVLNLGGTYNVTRVRYLPRQDGNPNGQITSYRIDTSMNGTSWTQVAQGTWAANATEKSATFGPTMAGYVRLEALQGVNGYAGAAEINIEHQP